MQNEKCKMRNEGDMRRITLLIMMLLLSLGLFATEAVQDSAKIEESKPQVTFLEFGSKTCIPCKQMELVLEAIEKEWEGIVEVKFIDVRKEINKQISREYKIRTIPTQVFLDAEGKEFFRHQGYFSEEKIVKMLKEHGITND